MPYFKWTGITLTASIIKGTRFARSQELLDQYLIEQDIALLSAEPYRWNPAFLYPISSLKKADFFSQLATLLKANVHLHIALRTLAAQGGAHRFSEIIEHIANDVEQGILLSDALKSHASIFNTIMIELCSVGQASNISTTLALLSTLLHEQEAYKKKLRSALSMPIITGTFFVIIMLIMFTIVVPHFADLLGSLDTQLPYVTQLLFSISEFFLSMAGIFTASILLGIVGAAWYFKRSDRGQVLYSTATFYTPYICTFTYLHNYMLFFNALGTMVQAGVPLLNALKLAKSVPSNKIIQAQCDTIITTVQEGKALSIAVEQTPTIPASLKALISVGEQTGNLGVLLLQAGSFCEQNLNTRLSFFAVIIQPLLLILLAGCVVILMLALYLPILSLSHTIQ